MKRLSLFVLSLLTLLTLAFINPAQAQEVNCSGLYPQWKIVHVKPSYVGPNTTLNIRGYFPQSAYCLPLSWSYVSLVNKASGLVTSYWRNSTYTNYITETDISLKPVYSLPNGAYYVYLHMCQGTKGLNDDCNQFQLVPGAVTIRNRSL